MGKDEETNEIKLRSDTRRKRLRCASDIIIRCSTFNVDEFVKSRIHQVFGVWYEIDNAISAC
jgi:hypothetical protein